jgi:predicted RND superfamily exporter protein
MLKERLALLVHACTRHAWAVIAAAALVTVLAGVYVARHFAIDTDINKLISADLPWRQQELAFARAFPQRYGTIFAVVDAPTAEQASLASAALANRLAADKALFTSVNEPGASPLFTRNGLLFLPTETVEKITGGLAQAQPLVRVLASDPSLRGLTQVLSFGLMGVQADRLKLDDMTRPLTLSATALEDVLAGRPASFSWQGLMRGQEPEAGDLRRFIEIRPVLDYGSLEPGHRATLAIRQAAVDLKLATEYQARVRLTGLVAIQDEEFGTLREGAAVNIIGTVAVVLLILWLALRSPRIILAVFLSTFVGLVITAALGLWMTTALNPISIAFAVLFIGIGVDFSIQFSVRYRAERHEIDDLAHVPAKWTPVRRQEHAPMQESRARSDSTGTEHALVKALVNAARNAGTPLTLAAATTAAGFLSFLPTAYGGFSELGAIAGVGMIVAYLMSVVLLPALLKVLNPPGEREPVGWRALAPIDRFTERHRMPIIIATLALVVAGLPLLAFLQFDFNPMNLRNPNTESIATYLDLRSDPQTGTNAIDALAPSLARAREMAARLEKVPEVSRVVTVDTFIPADQDAKLGFIRKAQAALAPAFAQSPRPPPSAADDVKALTGTAAFLTDIASDESGPGAAAAKRLAADLQRLAAADPPVRARAAAVFLIPLGYSLDAMRRLLQAEPVTLENIPADFAHDWIRPDGLARVQVYPRGDPNDNETLRAFARAVLAVEPAASGGPITILEAGRTVTTAFMQAGAMALVSIAVMLWITLRRIGDVLLTLIPLLIAGVVTLEICVAVGMPLNFANIIALPLLLGVGVAFKIYYIMAWRAGQTGLLQSSLTRAVIFSALTTATAFASLWLSSHPGTASMGKLLALTLATTMVAAVLFQPLLMGPPREVEKG